MTRDPAIRSDSLEEILTWFSSDRELAGEMYVQLRQDLVRIFVWRKCPDPEGLTDEVFDRVARKVHLVRPTYEGDPRLYFRAVANNLAKETFKKIGTHVPLEDVDLPNQPGMSEEAEAVDACLQRCLRKLTVERRELILAYYAKDKQAKIDDRQKLAQRCGISLETLRVKVYRIRESLEKCIEHCLDHQTKRK